MSGLGDSNQNRQVLKLLDLASGLCLTQKAASCSAKEWWDISLFAIGSPSAFVGFQFSLCLIFGAEHSALQASVGKHPLTVSSNGSSNFLSASSNPTLHSARERWLPDAHSKGNLNEFPPRTSFWRRRRRRRLRVRGQVWNTKITVPLRSQKRIAD